MPKPFLLESFEKHKAKGIARFRMGELEEAKYHFLKAAEYLLQLAKESDGKLRAARMKQAQELLTLAKTVKERKQKLREQAAAVKAGAPSSSEEDPPKVPKDWTLSEKPKLRFDDIAGLEDVKEQIRIKMILPFTFPDKAKRYKVKTGGGILLYGPPGTGKTMIAKAVAGELDATFFAIAPSEILNKWVGESEKNIRKLFESARSCPKAVIFIDEVESLIPKRRDAEAGGVMARVVPQILAELDGFEAREGQNVMFLGATNEPWSIDYAMLRPGRLDEKVYVGLPDLPARQKILEHSLREIPLCEDVDLEAMAKRLEGYSGADVSYLCRKVAEQTFLESVELSNERPVADADFQRVLKTLRPSVTLSDLDRFKKFKAGG
ncbi:MAG TPA: ATP-binding protein [Planctomycetota bacterium]|nr:ATP-binding protein [Planctomycetota bacterium]